MNLEQGMADQVGEGSLVGRGEDEDTCPISAVENWRAAAKTDSGQLFRVMNRG